MSDAVTLEGECLCGAVRFAASGPVHAMYLCHCSRCRKETGSAHAANIFLRDATLTWTRGGDSVRRYALPGTRKARSFCTTCGSPVARAAGATVIVPAGALDTPLTFAPTAHIFCDSRAPWEDLLPATPRHAALPG